MSSQQENENTKTVTNVTSYLKEVFRSTKQDTKFTLCYRGQYSESWKLKPSMLRGKQKRDAESNILSELTLEAHTEFSNDKSMFDKLVRAQHYNLSTRLLDVSLNPLVGLYFACKKIPRSKTDSKDGVVNIFKFKERRVKFPDSDTVSLICNLARLSDEEREEIDGTLNKASIDEFRETKSMHRLLQFVRVEKPYFLNRVERSAFRRYFFVHAQKNNPRVIAQSGAFIAAGLLNYNKMESSKGLKLVKIKIPSDRKKSILNELDRININSRTMFPEIEYASKYIKDKWME